LIRSPDCDILRPVIAKRILQHLLDNPAPSKIQNHKNRHRRLEFAREGHETHLFVHLGDEFRRAGEGNEAYGDETPVHAAVFADRFAEGTPLVVDSEGGNLLNKLEEIDGTVKEGRLEVAL
jgi:hypothetical protein